MLGGVPRLVEYFLFCLGAQHPPANKDGTFIFNPKLFITNVATLKLQKLNLKLEEVSTRAVNAYRRYVSRLEAMIYGGIADRLLLWATFGQRVSRIERITPKTNLYGPFTIADLEKEGTVFVSKNRPLLPWSQPLEDPTEPLVDGPVSIIVPYIWLQRLYKLNVNNRESSPISLFCDQKLSPEQNGELTLQVIAEKLRLLRIDYDYHVRFNDEKKQEPYWEVDLSSLVGIDSSHQYAEQLRKRKIWVDKNMNYTVFQQRDRLVSSADIKSFELLCP